MLSIFGFGLIIASFSAAGIDADWRGMLTMLVNTGRIVDFHSLRIEAGIGSRSQDSLPILSTKLSISLSDITLNSVISA